MEQQTASRVLRIPGEARLGGLFGSGVNPFTNLDFGKKSVVFMTPFTSSFHSDGP